MIPHAEVLRLWDPPYRPVILHVGAHRAEERLAYESIPDGMHPGEVWWLEANPHLIPELVAGMNKRVIHRPLPTANFVIHAAVTDIDGGEALLHLADESQCSSTLALGTTGERGVAYVDEVLVPQRTIDSLCAEHEIRPGMINLDIQGGELAALHGAVETLAGVEVVYTEVAETEQYVGVPKWDEVAAFVEDQGFRLGKIVMNENGEGWGDALFIRVGA